LGAQFKAETNAVRQQTTFKSWLANRENGFQLVSLAALLQLHTQREKIWKLLTRNFTSHIFDCSLDFLKCVNIPKLFKSINEKFLNFFF